MSRTVHVGVHYIKKNVNKEMFWSPGSLIIKVKSDQRDFELTLHFIIN